MSDFHKNIIDEIKLLIINNPEGFHKVGDLSRRIGYSPYHLSRLFRIHTGVTLGKYIKECKISLAAKMLIDTDLSIITVSSEMGFSSQQAFTRSFFMHFKLSPSDWRKKHRVLLKK